MIGLIANFCWGSTSVMKDLWMIRLIADFCWDSTYERGWPQIVKEDLLVTRSIADFC